jgi:hypothetical protein
MHPFLNKSGQMLNVPIMLVKKLLLLILFFTAISAFGQQRNDYPAMWKRIDSLLNKAGLPQSALKEVDAIYVTAKKEKNDVQLVRALIYKMTIADQLSDEGRYDNIKLIEKEITEAREPARSILHSIAGSSYWQYLQMNRWKFYNRTRVSNGKTDDIATMDPEQLYEKITGHYLSSISNEELLKSTPLAKFDPILVRGNSRQLRPTLYDLLAFRAVDYFKNDERDVTKPAYVFEISDSMAFADAAQFAKHAFQTSDTTSLHYRGLLVLQQLISFHLNDEHKDALIDADLQRLAFVHNFGTHPRKEELYENALKKIAHQYPGANNIADVYYQLAELRFALGNSYHPLQDTTNRYALNEAEQWCRMAIDTKTKTQGRDQAKYLLQEILSKQIKMETETVNVPGKPFRTLVTYKNIASANFRVVKVEAALRRAMALDQSNDSLWRVLTSLQSINEFSIALPDTKDHQEHSAEIKINALPVGEYAVIGSNEKNFLLKEGSLAVNFFHVSNIAYVHNDRKYYVLNRETGAPLSGATIQVWNQEYNYQLRKNQLRKYEKYVADKNGFFVLKSASNENRNIFLQITNKNDQLFSDDQRIYSYAYQNNAREEKIQSFLFTDRSLYRPGQIIYFKGIVIKRDAENNKNEIIANHKSVVTLYNANGEPVDSIALTTNEFGSYNGKFTLPSNLLNGRFSIHENESETSFQVEEYKRPKFYVEIVKPAGTYRVNDTVQVEGNARAYAGNNVNGATVTYRVTRSAIIPMWVRYGSTRIWPPYPRQEMEIAHGEAVTDENGRFVISFAAIPDNNLPAGHHPVFHYQITADVADLAGETRSANNSVSIGYESLQLQLDVPELVVAESLQKVSVSAMNMNDSFQTAQVNFNVYKLNAPNKIFRNRYWQQPDQFIMTKEEYYNNFPYDLYADETDMAKWERSSSIFSTQVTTNKQTDINIPSTLRPGWYLFEVTTKDKDNNTVTDKKYTQVYKNKLVSPLTAFSIAANKATAEPGDEINYRPLTNVENAYFIREIERKNDTLREISNASATDKIKITQTDRGNVNIVMAFVKNNRVYADNYTIEVPYYNKMLKIDYTTFRDKTLPGTNETWKVKISGMKGEKVAAELLTSMYDASLDQFYPHAWNVPGIWNVNSYSGNWNGNDNFRSVESIEKYLPRSAGDVFVKRYDQLLVQNVSDGRIYKSLAGRVQGVQLESSATAPSPVAQFAEKEDSFLRSPENTSQPNNQPPSVQPRKNLNETAFFFPALHTDSSGNVEFSFTTPEALTTWKWMLLAHTKELAFAYDTKKMITQKELMVQPNMPRFIREGDKIELSTRIVNMGANIIKGNATLSLTDPITGKTLDAVFDNSASGQTFTAKPGETVPVKFTITVPQHFTQPVTWKIIAVSANNNGSLSDGEESLLPVITNRMLVTETLPLPIRNTTEKHFTFTKLLNSGSSRTLQQQGVTIEFTANPAWYAVQALPYLTEEKNENAEAIFNRFYANAIAAHIMNSAPRIKSIIEQWKNADTSAFFSNLQKNEELKSALLEETPWVLEAKTEAQQKKNIAMLFDMSRMSSELNVALQKLKEKQAPSGGFVWFTGGPDDRYMTQYILSGIGHLKKLNAIPASTENDVDEIADAGLRYLDNLLLQDYSIITKQKNKVPAGDMLYLPIQYLYMRSFFTDKPVSGTVFPAYNYFRNLSKKDWTKQSKYMQGMLALSLFRTGELTIAKNIMASIKESSINSEEMGMYWKGMEGGYYWYQAPVETQSLLIEAFNEIGKDDKAVADMKTWLLKNKQTNNWKTSRATADACYALLLNGSDWLADTPEAQITLGEKQIDTGRPQAGTGYFKTTIPADAVRPSMGNINIKITSGNTEGRPAWGAVYWQYFEDLDKITGAATSLSISKKLFVQKNTDRGPVLEPLDENNAIHVGDRIKVRIEIRSDRTLEYVHLKDMRASAFEPVNVISSYKWNGGLGYYESTKDVSSNFFFSYLPKGVHIFEYDLFATHAGTFSNGISTIQCMYAPEFSSHTEGTKVNVVNK